MVALSFVSATQTTLTLAQSSIAGGATNMEWQYATRRDFDFCIAPIITVGLGANVTIGGLNRAQTYWIRGREASGTARAAWSTAKAFSTLTGADSVISPGVQIQPVLIMPPQPPTAWGGPLNILGYDPSNLEYPSPAAAWRGAWSGSSFSFWIETDGRPVDTIALLDTNLPENATVRFYGGSTSDKAIGVSTPDASTAAVPFRASSNLRGRRGYHGLFRLTTPLTNRFIGVIIQGERPPMDICHVTHAVFGQARLLRNYADMSDSPFDLGSFERLRDGTPDAVPGFRMRKVDFTVSAMTETQHETAFADLAQMVGTNEPVLVVPNTKIGPYLHDRILYGNLTSSRQSNSNMRFERALTCESIVN